MLFRKITKHFTKASLLRSAMLFVQIVEFCVFYRPDLGNFNTFLIFTPFSYALAEFDAHQLPAVQMTHLLFIVLIQDVSLKCCSW